MIVILTYESDLLFLLNIEYGHPASGGGARSITARRVPPYIPAVLTSWVNQNDMGAPMRPIRWVTDLIRARRLEVVVAREAAEEGAVSTWGAESDVGTAGG